MDDIINRTLELRYSLVAASVPGLDNLHLMPQFAFQFVSNPVVFKFNETVSYEPGSGIPLIVYVSAYVYVAIKELLAVHFYCVCKLYA